MSDTRALLCAAGAAVFLAAAADAQRDKRPHNDPEHCGYCGGDPERMAKAAVVSHGGFEFGESDTATHDQILGATDVYWIETEHFEIGLAVGPYRPLLEEKAKIREELTQLAEVLPDVSPKTRSIDPWLRTHLFAQRVEETWGQMLEVLEVEEGDFPDGSAPWDMTGEYMGEGPFLGQKGKYELLVLPSEALHAAYLQQEFGLTTRVAQRWNVAHRDTLNTVMHLQEGALKKDVALHCAVAFNLAHQLLDGYKHYSYDTPIWLHVGLAHWFSRNIDPKYNSFDSGEGGTRELTRKWKWDKEVLGLVRRGKTRRLAELMASKSYADIDLSFHFQTWSMVGYLIEVHPEGFARHLRNICGNLDEDGIADGSNMGDVHRSSLRASIGMSYAGLDSAWRSWVEGIEPEPEDDGSPFGDGRR